MDTHHPPARPPVLNGANNEIFQDGAMYVADLYYWNKSNVSNFGVGCESQAFLLQKKCVSRMLLHERCFFYVMHYSVRNGKGGGRKGGNVVKGRGVTWLK